MRNKQSETVRNRVKCGSYAHMCLDCRRFFLEKLYLFNWLVLKPITHIYSNLCNFARHERLFKWLHIQLNIKTHVLNQRNNCKSNGSNEFWYSCAIGDFMTLIERLILDWIGFLFSPHLLHLLLLLLCDFSFFIGFLWDRIQSKQLFVLFQFNGSS